MIKNLRNIIHHCKQKIFILLYSKLIADTKRKMTPHKYTVSVVYIQNAIELEDKKK